MDIIEGVSWRRGADTSYAAAVAYLHIPLQGGMPEILLVEQTPGEGFRQKGGGVFERRNVLKIPIGREDKEDGGSPIKTAEREFLKETSVSVSGMLSFEQSTVFRIESKREGSVWHDDVFFCVVSPKRPEINPDKIDEKEDVEGAAWYPLDSPEIICREKLPLQLIFGHRIKLAEILKRVPDQTWFAARVDEDALNEIIWSLVPQQK